MSTSVPDSTAEDAQMPGDEATSTEIAERTAGITEHTVSVMPLLTDEQIRTTWRTAKALAASRMFKDAAQAEQAFAKILIGRDLGISATQSLMAIDLVKGAIQLRGVLLASFIRKSEGYDYKVLEKTHTKSRVLFLGYPSDEQFEGGMRHAGRWWEVLGEEEFTIEDAERAKLVKNDSAWQSHPKNMCFWRCISNGVKTHAPELLGGIPVYVEGELDRTPSGSYSQVPAAQASAQAEVHLPEEIAQLVVRAHAIDPTTWRPAEVAARLPEQGAEGYTAALESMRVELTEWLAEHDPPEAEVVDAEPVGDGNETVDVVAALQQRWDSDEEWRGQVGPLLSRYADVESALDGAVGEGDEANAEKWRDELNGVADALDALEVPVGWFPASAGAES